MSTIELMRASDPQAQQANTADAHRVQFYNDEPFLVNSVARHLSTSLRNGGSAIVLATKDHRGQILQELAKLEIPADALMHTLVSGPPRVRDFAAVDPEVAGRAGRVGVVVDDSLPQFGAALAAGGVELARVPCPRGAPERPASPSQLAAKVMYDAWLPWRPAVSRYYSWDKIVDVTVYLTNMKSAGASHSASTMFHYWFAHGTRWEKAGGAMPGPPPGYLVGGPNPYYSKDAGCAAAISATPRSSGFPDTIRRSPVNW